jgi:hypothetical protein
LHSVCSRHNPREDAYVEALESTGGDYILAKAAQAFSAA